MPFPYLEILKKAFELAKANLWLWVFGFFIGGTTGLNLGGFNYVATPHKIEEFSAFWAKVQNSTIFFVSHSGIFYSLLILVSASAFLALVLSGISRGAVIWTTAKSAEHENSRKAEISFAKALSASKKYLWQIIGLQILISAGYGVLLLLLAAPVGYFFSIAAIGRAVASLLLALLIFIPATFVFGFLHIYGPIFLVLYPVKISTALQLSFNLLRQKIKESLILAAFLVGISLLFVLAVIFSIIVVSVPVALLALFLLKLNFWVAFYTLIFGAAIFELVFTLVVSAGFAVFQNAAWVLAVQAMVKAKKIEERAEKVLAAEPVA
jgi:hypothetical protein